MREEVTSLSLIAGDKSHTTFERRNPFSLSDRVRCALRALLAVVVAYFVFASAQLPAAVTNEDLDRARLPEYAGYRKKFDYANSLAAKLEYDTPVPIILDTVTNQISAWIEMNLSHKILSVTEPALALAALAKLDDAPVRLASLQGLTGTALFLAGNEKEGLAKSEAAIRAQIAVASEPVKHPYVTVLLDQMMTHISLLGMAGQDVKSLQYLRIAEQLLPFVKNSEATRIDIELSYELLFSMLGDFDRAAGHLANAERLAIQGGDEDWLMVTYKQKVEAQIASGDAKAALTTIAKYAALGRKLKVPQTVGNAHDFSSSAYSMLGDYSAAAHEARRAIEVHDQNGHASATSYRRLAINLARLGQVPAAQKALRDALALRADPVDGGGDWWSYDVAQARSAIAAAIGDREATVKALANENSIRRAMERKKAIEQTRALREFHEIESRETEIASLKYSNQLNELAMQRDQARIYWQRIAIAAMATLLVFMIIAALLLRRRARVLRQLAETDALTGAHSRGAVLARADAAFMDAQSQRRDIAVSVIDIDHFKQFNDLQGHDLGDRVLTHCADVIQNNLRQGDLLGRIGGDEFLVVLDNATETQARATLERIASAIKSEWIEETGSAPAVSISAGVASIVPNENDDVKHLIQRADRALIYAKQAGRQRVASFSAVAA